MQFFTKNDDQFQRNLAAICFSNIFESREIKDEQISAEILGHLWTLANDPKEWEKHKSILELEGLAQNAVNRTQIESVGFVFPQ
ncbi:MAG: hypothetical protein EZS28_002994 [Streblomastix strix]|uniref:Uncharacterized protein n=1 Tax=Streblomastix strix TaxID=222440 RepID=A0A5J4X407_9EUKA|nr:MAG: hypothetical protein EZS28_002994 [Streblomastix strix]